jgi:hypothetical protein
MDRLISPTTEATPMRYVEVVIRGKEETGETGAEPPCGLQRLERLTLVAGPRQERIDRLEAATLEQGGEMMRTISCTQWALRNQALARSRQPVSQDGAGILDGKAARKLASRLGLVSLPQQICSGKTGGTPFLPRTPVLLAPPGMLGTRGRQEWAGLLPQELPGAPAAPLLRWPTHAEQRRSDPAVRQGVRKPGHAIRHAEATESKALEACSASGELPPNRVPLEMPWRHPSWPAELSAAVDAALAIEDPPPPHGVSPAEWERVLTYHRAARHPLQAEEDEWTPGEEEPRSGLTEAAPPALARHGPEVRAGEVVAATDEGPVRAPQRRHGQDLRTARVTPSQGSRYRSGTGEAFLTPLSLLLLLGGYPTQGLLTVWGDGARGIQDFCARRGVRLGQQAELILAWYPRKQQCDQLTRMLWRGRKTTQELLKLLLRHWGHGEVDLALILWKA